MADVIRVTEDLRIRRTRHALRKALWELASQKTFQSISIQDICSRAEVNRTTFYYHWEFAFVQSTITEVLPEVLIQLFDKHSTIKVLEQMPIELAAIVASWAISDMRWALT